MSTVSYTLNRVFLFVWRWQTDCDWGVRSETGLAVGRLGARWKARGRLRQLRKALSSPERRRP